MADKAQHPEGAGAPPAVPVAAPVAPESAAAGGAEIGSDSATGGAASAPAGLPEDEEVLGVFDADDEEGVQAAMEALMAQQAEEEAAEAAAGEVDEALTDSSRLQMTEHEESVYCLAVSPAEPVVVSGDGDDSWVLWDLRDGSVRARSKAHSDTVIDVGFNWDGSLFATGAMDKTVRVWRAGDGSEVACLEGPSEDVQWLAWHPKGNLLAAGADDCTVWVWDVATGVARHVLGGHTAPVLCGGWTPSGKLLVTSGADGATKLWDGKTGACVHTFVGHGWHEHGIVSQAVHPSRPLVLVGGEDGTARLANLASKKVLATYAHLRPQVAEEGISTSTVTTAMGGGDVAAAVEAAGGEGAVTAPEALPTGGPATPAPAATAAGGAASPGEDEEAPNVEELHQCSVEGTAFFGGAGSDDAMRWAATAATDGTLRVWDLAGSDERAALRHSILHPDALIAVRWHAVHPVLFSACADGVVRLWDARTGALVKEYTGHLNMVLDMALVHPGTYAVAEPGAGAGAGGDAAAAPGAPPGPAMFTKLQLVTAGDDQVCRVFDV